MKRTALLTLLSIFQPGVPRSRAKAQVILEAVAIKLMVAQMLRILISEAIVSAPGRLPTAWRKISMKG